MTQQLMETLELIQERLEQQSGFDYQDGVNLARIGDKLESIAYELTNIRKLMERE